MCSLVTSKGPIGKNIRRVALMVAAGSGCAASQAALARMKEGAHPGSRWWPCCIRQTGLCDALQQMRNRTDARVRYESNHACASGAYGDAVRLRENRIRSCDLQRSSEGIAAQHQKPGFPFRLQTPCGVRRQVDPLEHKVGAGDEKHAVVSKAVRPHPERSRARICHCYCTLDVKFSLAAMVEQPEGRLTALLDLGNYQPRADCVNRPSGDENDIVREYGPPRDKIRNRAVVHCPAQLLSGELAAESECDPGTGRRTKDVPRLRFAVRQSHRPRIRVVGMDLDGKGFAREKQLDQKRRTQGGITRSIVPDFADRDASVAGPIPGP